jgi:integrase
MSTIHLSLRLDVPATNGKCPIKLLYQLHGDRKPFYPGMKLHPANWDQDEQMAIYIDKKAAKVAAPGKPYDELLTAQEAAEFNRSLDSWKQRMADVEKRFELDQVQYSASMVIEQLQQAKGGKTKKAEPSKFVFDYIDRYVEDNRATRVKGSLVVYTSLKSHLQAFEKRTRTKVRFEDIDHNFMRQFQNYLVTEGGLRKNQAGERIKEGLCNTTVAKQLSTLKTFLGYAKADGIAVNDNFRMFKIKKQDGAVIALTQAEFDAMINLDLKPGSTQDHVRNAFVFACATGLRYSDLKQLSWDHIKRDEIVINIVKKKRLIPHQIPLTPYSRSILKKYEGKLRPLHVISGQKMNDYLKGKESTGIKSICEMAGISEPTKVVRYRGARTEEIVVPKFRLIGPHTGRKTFCTLSLEKGMSAEETMAVSGHDSYASFKRYVNVTNDRKKKAMGKAWAA